jgi:class 3 adenylate cyclase
VATVVDERALDERLARLETARSWSPRVVSRLEALIREGEDAALFRVNPFTLAGQRDIAPEEAIDLLLHAAAQGLFEMDWLLVCPRCACAVESFARLRAVLRRFRCPECRNEYEAAMDDYIAVYFTVSPRIRAIRHHRPETLDPFDYMYLFKGVREARMPDGEPFIEASRAALRGIGFLEPGGTAGFAFAAAPGAIDGVSPDTEAGFRLRIVDDPTGPRRVRLTYRGTGFEPEEAVLSPGPVELEIANPTAERRVVALLQSTLCQEDCFLRFDPYLTGKHLLTSQTFKSLFRSEVVGGAEGLAIRDIALLFTDIRGSTALYRRIGDLNAFQLVQRHFDWLREATVRHGGAVVKTIGDAVMAAYPDAARAVGAALDMREAVERFNRDQPEQRAVSLKIGVHHGAAIAVTLNEQLDYFGQTVNIASRVQEMADAGEIWITEEVWSYPGVQELLGPYPVEPRTAEFRGVGHPLAVRRIGASGQAVAA